jgi:glucokinase
LFDGLRFNFKVVTKSQKIRENFCPNRQRLRSGGFSGSGGAMNFISVEIGGSKLQVVAGNENGELLEWCRFEVDREAGGEGIRSQIASALPALIERNQPMAVGVGYGGPVDWRTGRIKCSHHVKGWDDFPLGEWLSAQCGLPVFVENDANVAALGEAIHGAGRDFSHVAWVNCGSGVGGGLVVNRAIYHGAIPGEMEIGHLRLDQSGTIVEDRCSGWAVDRTIRAAIAAEPESTLARLLSGQPAGGEARMLGAALAQSCPIADRILTAAMTDLAFGLSHVVQLAHPQVIVVGGGLHLIGEPVRARIAAALPRWVMSAFCVPEIALARLGEDAVTVGGLALAASRFDEISRA